MVRKMKRLKIKSIVCDGEYFEIGKVNEKFNENPVSGINKKGIFYLISLYLFLFLVESRATSYEVYFKDGKFISIENPVNVFITEEEEEVGPEFYIFWAILFVVLLFLVFFRNR